MAALQSCHRACAQYSNSYALTKVCEHIMLLLILIMFIFSLSAAILSIFSFILAFFVFFTKTSDRRARYLGCAIFFFALWLLGNTRVDIAKTVPEVILYNTVLTLGISFYITFFAFFVDAYIRPKEKISLLTKCYYIGFSLFFVLFAPTEFAFTDIAFFSHKPVEEALGPMWLIFFVFYFYAHINVFKKLRNEIRTAAGSRINQARYILLGSMLAFFGGVFFDLVLPLFGELRFYNLGPQFSFFFIAATTYAILRHQLLDIRIVLERSLIYAILVGIITLLYLVTLFTMQDILGLSAGQQGFWGALITALIGIFTVPMIERQLRKATTKIFFHTSYSYSDTLHALSEISNNNIQITDIVTKTSTTLRSVFQIESIYIFLPRQKKILSGDGEQENLDVYPTAHTIDCVMKNEKTLDCADLAALLDANTTLSKEEKAIIDIFNTFCIEKELVLSIPLRSDNLLVGIILLGKKRSGDTYTSQDKQLLMTFAHQFAVALEKARLYEQVKTYSAELESKVHERTKKLKKLQERQSQMLLDLSHGLQTPLTVIKGEIGQLSDQKKDIYKPIQRSIDYLSQYVTDILTLAKMEFNLHQKKEKINASLLVDEIIEYFTIIATQQNIQVTSTIQSNLYIYGILHQIQKLVKNLLSNAIKYIANERTICVSLEQKGAHIILRVQDTGIGIPEKDIPYLFERFYRVVDTRKKVQGTGLGLAISAQIVENHNGTINVKSTLGKGTLITVQIPCA